MIIMFRGTQVSKNYAPQVLALYATINAVKYSRKTLVLQFMQEFPVEKILRGQRDEEENVINREKYQFNDSGMDSLFRKVENQRLEKENFDLACRAMLKADNQLDVASVSAKRDFLKEIPRKKEYIAQILEYAKDIYDDIYILGHGKHPETISVLNPLVDISIVCIAQGSKEEVEELTTAKGEVDPDDPNAVVETNDYLYMVTEFDNRSSFDVAKLKKAYDVKRIALNPYNTGFKDAYNSGTVLAFAINNTEVQPNDSNYGLFSAVYDVQNQIMGNVEEEKPQFVYEKLINQTPEKEVIHDLKKLDASHVRYTKKYRSSIFGKKEVDGYEVTLNRFEDEISGDETIDEENIEEQDVQSSIEEIDEMTWDDDEDFDADNDDEEEYEVEIDEDDEEDEENFDDDDDFNEFDEIDDEGFDEDDDDEDFKKIEDEDEDFEEDDFEEIEDDDDEELEEIDEDDDEYEEIKRPLKRKREEKTRAAKAPAKKKKAAEAKPLKRDKRENRKVEAPKRAKVMKNRVQPKRKNTADDDIQIPKRKSHVTERKEQLKKRRAR